MTRCSLLISTYNWPAALELCLDSVLTQSVMPDEIIICDDGSTEDTRKVIVDFTKISPVPVIHVWQEDKAFRLAMIRNKGFAASKGDYIIQTDGDLIFHHHFIKDHLRFSKPGTFTTGSRVLLSPETTQALFKNRSLDIKKHSKNDKNFFNSFHIPALHEFFSLKYKNKGKNTYYVKGCNMAFWKKDLLHVNGYNEDFTGWGKEDSELAIRLINSGVKKRFLKFGGICYHLFHKEATRDMEEKNTEMMNNAKEKKLIRALNGIDRLN